MKKLTKVLALLITFALLLTCLNGCSSNKPSSTSESSKSTAAQTSQAAASTTAGSTSKDDFGGMKMPIVDKKITLTYFVQNPWPTVIKDYNEMKMYQIQEKDTGIHIEFIHPAAGQEKDQLNLLIASNDLPDIMDISPYNPITYPGGPAKLLSDGTAVELNDMIDKYAPNLKKILKEHPDTKKEMSTDDGKLYCFPWLNFHDIQCVYLGFIMREDWLQKLSLKLPETMDDWYNVLKAFKEKDPNGNNKNDEIPFISKKYDGIDFKILPFEFAWGITADFYETNGVIKYGPMQPEFKEYLSTMRKWYAEGLLDPDYATTDAKQFDAKATNDTGGAFYGYAGGGIRVYMNQMEKSKPEYKLTGTQYPVLKSGQKPPIGHRITSYTGNAAVIITSKNKYLKETVQWLDYGYSPKGYLLNSYGVEGESYNMVNGYPKFVDSIAVAANGFKEVLTKFNRFPGAGPWEHGKEAQEQYMSLPAQQKAIELWSNAEKSCFLPPLTPSQEESLRLNTIANEAKTYVGEMVNKFIMGQEPIDKFDNFVATLKKMNIEEAVKIEQAAYDRYKTR